MNQEKLDMMPTKILLLQRIKYEKKSEHYGLWICVEKVLLVIKSHTKYFVKKIEQF